MNTKTALVKVIINNIGASDILKAVIRAIDKLEGKDIRDIILAIFAYMPSVTPCAFIDREMNAMFLFHCFCSLFRNRL